MAKQVDHQQVVQKLLDTKAVDFRAIGDAVAELGPSIALADEPWDGFCGTMRTFVHVFILRAGGGSGGNPPIDAPAVEDLAALRGATEELQN